MKEVKVKVQPYMVRAMCECSGEFEPTGMCLSSYPVQYEHQCNRCNEVRNFDCRYPKIVYEEIIK